MAKQRKTRRQKEASDSRRKVNQPVASSSTRPGIYTYSLQPNSPVTTDMPHKTSSQTVISNAYVLTDLRKTFLTTLAIIAAQLVLLVVLKK